MKPSLLSWFACVFAMATVAEEPAAPPPQTPAASRRSDELIVYKTTAQKPRHLYLYKPADWKSSDRRAAMVFIHGGGWTKGSPQAARPWAEVLGAHGMVVLSVEYRLAEAGPGLDPSASIEDAKSAMRFVRGHAAELGIDPGRIAAAGSSAGGHLAAACALLPGFEPEADSHSTSCRPDALVLLQPVIDNGPDGGYGYTSPIIQADYARFSPAHHVGPGAPPSIIFGGRSDRAAKLDLLKRFDASMHEKGNACELHEYDGVHGFANGPLVLPDIESKVISFFTRLGWLAAGDSAPAVAPANKKE